MKMILPALLIFALTGSAAHACTNWQAIAVFDAAIVTAEQTERKEYTDRLYAVMDKLNATMNDDQKKLKAKMLQQIGEDIVAAKSDRAAALADKCGE